MNLSRFGVYGGEVTSWVTNYRTAMSPLRPFTPQFQT
jgi:hypothetical protein